MSPLGGRVDFHCDEHEKAVPHGCCSPEHMLFLLVTHYTGGTFHLVWEDMISWGGKGRRVGSCYTCTSSQSLCMNYYTKIIMNTFSPSSWYLIFNMLSVWTARWWCENQASYYHGDILMLVSRSTVIAKMEFVVNEFSLQPFITKRVNSWSWWVSESTGFRFKSASVFTSLCLEVKTTHVLQTTVDSWLQLGDVYFIGSLQ